MPLVGLLFILMANVAMAQSSLTIRARIAALVDLIESMQEK
jgi:hypothetical protein